MNKDNLIEYFSDGIKLKGSEKIGTEHEKFIYSKKDLFHGTDLENYSIEVSSPGINRPLYNMSDFIKYQCEKVFVELKRNINNQKIFKGGKIYDPRSGNTYKSNLYLSQDGILKVEGCLAFICDGEEWQPLIVKINEDGSREAILKNSLQSN